MTESKNMTITNPIEKWALGFIRYLTMEDMQLASKHTERCSSGHHLPSGKCKLKQQ